MHFLLATTPTPEWMMAVLVQVHKVIDTVAEDLDIDSSPAVCVVGSDGIPNQWLSDA